MIACSRSRHMAPITAALIYVDQPVRNRFHGVALPGLLYVAVLIVCSGADRLTQLHIETERPTGGAGRFNRGFWGATGTYIPMIQLNEENTDSIIVT
jgi:hypothetical protein